VRTGNGEWIAVKDKETEATEGHTSLKLIFDVLYVLEINQHLFNVTQLLEKKAIECYSKENIVWLKMSEAYK